MTQATHQTQGRAPYFVNLQSALQSHGVSQPVIVIDRDILDRNIAFLRQDLPKGMDLRIVAKSLPSLPLLKHVLKGTGSTRVMTFNLPMLIEIAAELPEVDQMLGKPMLVSAARQFLEAGLPPKAQDQVQWLVDTPQRLAQYAELARQKGVTLRIALELDIGFHRGGFAIDNTLSEAMRLIANSEFLTLSALMGYEPYLPKIPTFFGWQARAKQSAWAAYTAANRMAEDVFGAEFMETVVRNTAGSPTFRLYKDTAMANEISVGSALLKPTDFDTELLELYQPAAFIAAPVLKALDGTNLPGLYYFDRIKRLLNRSYRKSIFIHGGYWRSKPVDPPTLKENAIFGRSTNQDIFNTGADVMLKADDFVFFRPAQSEAILMQFSQLVIMSGGKVADTWAAFAPSA